VPGPQGEHFLISLQFSAFAFRLIPREGTRPAIREGRRIEIRCTLSLTLPSPHPPSPRLRRTWRLARARSISTGICDG